MSAHIELPPRARRSPLTSRVTRVAGGIGRPPADDPGLHIRLIGLPGDVAAGLAALRAVLDVVSVSPPCASRDSAGYVRVYVAAKPRPAGEEDGRCISS